MIDAFSIAHSGDIDEEKSEESQQARETIRAALKNELSNYHAVAGEKLRLHFHLPNGRSLVRLWRAKQAKRSGEWVDISDDISSFRNTVLDVNRLGTALGGIELGRGGFAIRGLVPVKGTDGKIIGSAEVLQDFAPILKKSEQAGISTLLFMNKSNLQVTTSLRDAQKYPVVGSDYVLVSATNKNTYLPMIDRTLLTQGRSGETIVRKGNVALAALPIEDYRGQQIGILVGAVTLDNMTVLARQADEVLLLALGAMLIIPIALILFTVRRCVLVPVRAISRKIQDITEDRADLNSLLEVGRKDEVGDLAGRFNQLLRKIASMFEEMEGYKIVLDTVPDPIFAVDAEFNVILANKALSDFSGLSTEALKRRKCSQIFRTQLCATPACPIAKSMKSGAMETAEIITVKDITGTPVSFQPLANELKNAEGSVIGYVEVVRNVTELILKEQEIQSQLETIHTANKTTREASTSIASSSEALEREVVSVNDSISTQQKRIAETTTAMQQMNAAVLEVAQGASLASDKAVATRDKAQEGANIVENAVNAIISVRSRTDSMRDTMQQLGVQANSIGAVLNVISDIADQTNLLALNAAIEAARAGDAGRGFAVVADEVRKLAEKTMAATREVENSIQGIQKQARDSISTTESTSALVVEAAEYADDSGLALEEIVALAQESANEAGGIATAAEQQSASTEEINAAMEDVNNLVTDLSSRMHQSSQAVIDLARLAGELRELAGK